MGSDADVASVVRFGYDVEVEGGVVSASVVRVDGGRAVSVARFVSRHTIVAAFVAVIAMIFHVTGSTGPHATANQSVLVLAILVAQISLPRRQLRYHLRGGSFAVGAPQLEPSQHG